MNLKVIKTLLMNAKKGEYNGIFDTVRQVLKHDKLGIKIFIIFNHKDKK